MRSIEVAAFAGALALTAVLVRLAVPAYQNYTIRHQVAAGVELAHAKKPAIVAAWEAAGRDFSNVHSDSTSTSLEGRSKYVTSVEVVSGAIVITYGGEAYGPLRGRSLTIVPALDAEEQSVEWQCGRGTAPKGFEPIFEEPARLTDVPDDYLPAACRSR